MPQYDECFSVRTNEADFPCFFAQFRTCSAARTRYWSPHLRTRIKRSVMGLSEASAELRRGI